MDKVEEFLIEFISQNSGVDISKIDTNVDIFESAYIDSIGIFTLLVEIENEFDKSITLEEISTLEQYTIKNIKELIESA